MPKLICGLSKEIQLPDGCRSASVRLEIELEPATVRDAAKLKHHIRCGFDRVRSAIDEELAREVPADDASFVEHGTRNCNGRIRPRMPK